MSRFQHFGFPSSDFFRWVDSKLPPSACPCSQDSAFQSLVTLLANRLGAKHVLCEEGYIDADFQSLCSCWYAKSFKQVPNLCCRVHFASEVIDEDALITHSFKDESYLGYAVLAPLNTGRVGRTVVRPWNCDINIVPDIWSPMILSANSPVHLYGRRLIAKGAPYTSQDAMVIVCAQAAIWMALNYMHFRYTRSGLKRVLPDEVTNAASENLRWAGRLLPSGGLTAEHIANALSNLGYSPIVDTRREDGYDWDPMNWIQKYLDSDIPVILALWHPPHAIVAIGSLLGCVKQVELDPQQRIASLDKWVGGLIVNDDNLGPYKIMPRLPEQTAKLATAYSDLLSGPDTWETVDHINALFVPLPQEVSIQARHVDVIIEGQVFGISPQNKILSRLIQHANDKDTPTLYRFLLCLLGHITGDRIVTRAYLVKSMEYLRRIQEAGNYADGIKSFFKKQQYPPFIWVVELYSQSEVESKRPTDRQAFGEVILDASANRFDPSWLIVHIGGLILLRDVVTESISQHSVGNINPFRTWK